MSGLTLYSLYDLFDNDNNHAFKMLSAYVHYHKQALDAVKEKDLAANAIYKAKMFQTKISEMQQQDEKEEEDLVDQILYGDVFLFSTNLQQY